MPAETASLPRQKGSHPIRSCLAHPADTSVIDSVQALFTVNKPQQIPDLDIARKLSFARSVLRLLLMVAPK